MFILRKLEEGLTVVRGLTPQDEPFVQSAAEVGVNFKNGKRRRF